MVDVTRSCEVAATVEETTVLQLDQSGTDCRQVGPLAAEQELFEIRGGAECGGVHLADVGEPGSEFLDEGKN